MKSNTLRLAFVAILALSFSIFASAQQDHTCQGGHNCDTTGTSGGTTNVTNTNTNTPTATATSTGDTIGGGAFSSTTAYSPTSSSSSTSGPSTSSANTGSGSIGGVNFGSENTGTQNTNTANGGAGGSSSAQGGTGIGIGGNSNAQGGSSSVKDSGNSSVKDSGNSASFSNAKGGSVKNSGNSSNENLNLSSNKNSNKQGQAQGQEQGQSQNAISGSSSAASNNGNGNGNGANNTSIVTNVAAPKIPVSTAYAPYANSTVPCAMGYSGGGQGMLAGATGGFTRVDKTCQQLETARSFAISGARKAYCQVMISTKWAKKAGVTMDSCMYQDAPPQTVASPAAIVEPVVPAVIVNPYPSR